jgi:hypothetical protein
MHGTSERGDREEQGRAKDNRRQYSRVRVAGGRNRARHQTPNALFEQRGIPGIGERLRRDLPVLFETPRG